MTSIDVCKLTQQLGLNKCDRIKLHHINYYNIVRSGDFYWDDIFYVSLRIHDQSWYLIPNGTKINSQTFADCNTYDPAYRKNNFYFTSKEAAEKAVNKYCKLVLSGNNNSPYNPII